MEIPFVGGAYSGRSTNLNAQVCQNLYPILDREGGKKIIALMNTPGLIEFADLGTGEIRGMEILREITGAFPESRKTTSGSLSLAGTVLGLRSNPYVPFGKISFQGQLSNWVEYKNLSWISQTSYLYSVLGNTVYRISANGGYKEVTGKLLTSSGKVWMANNGNRVVIVDGSYGYTVSGTTLTQITDPDFPTPVSVTYQDGYFIVVKRDSRDFYVSGIDDPDSWDALDYDSKIGFPDYLQAAISSHLQLWLIGEKSFEVWYNSGNADFPFDKISGASAMIGCSARNSICEHLGAVAWLDDKNTVRVSSGYEAQRISTSQIEYQFSTYARTSDAIGFMYTQEGHTFYVLTFPTPGKTWAYDFMTGYWHTRASDSTDLRHRANCYANFEGMHIVGDYSNGKLYKYDLGTYTDDGTTLRRRRTAQAIMQDRKNLFHKSLEIEFESGGTDDPQAMLDWSDDGGHTWSNEHWTSIGALGNYKARAIWRRLGRSRDRIYRLTISDATKTVILGAYLDADMGRS